MKFLLLSTLLISWASYSNSAANDSFDIKINSVCSEPAKHEFMSNLVLIECIGNQFCSPDPDDVAIVDVKSKVESEFGISGMVVVDENLQIVPDKGGDSKYRFVWDISLPVKDHPSSVQIYYDGEPMTPEIVLQGQCSVFPEHIRKRLGI